MSAAVPTSGTSELKGYFYGLEIHPTSGIGDDLHTKG